MINVTCRRKEARGGSISTHKIKAFSDISVLLRLSNVSGVRLLDVKSYTPG